MHLRMPCSSQPLIFRIQSKKSEIILFIGTPIFPENTIVNTLDLKSHDMSQQVQNNSKAICEV